MEEFEARLAGATYEEIARQGGGIMATVRDTRAASQDDLVKAAARRLHQMMREGLTTIEVKSGYGLDRETEIRMLKVARELGKKFSVRVCTTYLGLHALPPEYTNNRAGYIRLVTDEILPALKKEGLVDAVDAFMEPIAFTGEEISIFFQAAKRLGIPVKLHADQRGNRGGAVLAAEFHALSADHVEYADEVGVKALAQAGTVAVILPGAFLFLRETQKPPLELPKNLRAMKSAVDREGGLIEQVILPALRSHRAEQRQEALDALEELAQAMSQLQQLLLTRYIRRLTV